MASILYTCPYVPAEWISAHGLEPSRVAPDSRPGDLGAGVCPFAEAFVHAVRTADARGVVVTTACDQMRRAAEMLCARTQVPAFLMNVPSTWDTVTSYRMYSQEVRRLGRFLQGLGGHDPSAGTLAGCMEESDARRRSRAWHVPPPGMARPLVLVGGPMLRQDLWIFDLVSGHGAWVAVDGTDSGARCVPRPFDRRHLREDPFGELVDAYWTAMPDVRRRPNSQFYQWLAACMRDTRAIGLIVYRHVWCDLWHAEVARIRERAQVPVLDLVSSGDGHGAGSYMGNRVQAFVEALRP